MKLACLLLPSLAAISLAATETPSPSPETEIRFSESVPLTNQDQIVLERFIGHAVSFAGGLTEEKLANKCREKGPESFCWVEFRYLNCLNVAYQLTGDTHYLDLFRDSFALFRKIMTKGPDEYWGWYGKPIPSRRLKDQPDLEIDELQMNFRAIALLSLWVELARDDPDYAKANKDVIDSYLDLMEKHLFPKWDERGFFVMIPGQGGVYRGLDYPSPNRVTLSFEKMAIMVHACLSLYRGTGNDLYLKRALQLGAWFKSNLILKDDHYEWMSWLPTGQWDVHSTKEDSWAPRWMGPDPNGAWYVSSLSIALNLYQHGLLFNEVDLGRFLKTQKTMCWNGDMQAPEYRTVAGVKNKWVKGRFLSNQLAHYDPTLQELAFHGPHEDEALKHSENSWHGGSNAQDYVQEKFIMEPIISENPQPYRDYGTGFLEDDNNKAFYDVLTSPENNAARKPSHLLILTEPQS